VLFGVSQHSVYYLKDRRNPHHYKRQSIKNDEIFFLAAGIPGSGCRGNFPLDLHAAVIIQKVF
jgi:hypothetical protein